MKLALVILLVCSLASADDRAGAEKYFAAGEAAYRQQSFGAAAEQFELAYKALPLPEIAFSAAQAYRRQYYVTPKPEFVKRAVELYRIYLDAVKTGGRVADASDGIAEMQREYERLTLRGEKIGEVQRDKTRIAVSVSIAGEQRSTLTDLASMPATAGTGAKALLDGAPIELFAPIDCKPGTHTIQVTASGYVSAQETRQVVEGSTELVEVTLAPLPAHVTVTTEEGALIELDGRALGFAPLAVQVVAAGSHTLAITHRGRVPIEKKIEVGRGEQRAFALPMAITGRRKLVPWLALTTGVLAAGTITTTIFAFHYDSQMANLDAERAATGITIEQLKTYRTDANKRDDYRDAAFALGGATVVAGLATAALYYFDVPTLGEHAAVVPTGVSGTTGIAVAGRF